MVAAAHGVAVAVAAIRSGATEPALARVVVVRILLLLMVLPPQPAQAFQAA